MTELVNDVRPFRGEQYDPAKVGSVGPCLAQPYDVISPAMQDAYYRQHPYNVVRLILNKITPTDTEGDNRYSRSRETLAQWRREGVLCTSAEPGFWVYQQEF